MGSIVAKVESNLASNLYHLRIVGNHVQFGAKKTFCRWANSVDFVYNGLPSPKQCERLKAAVERIIESGDYNTGWGEERVMNGHFRRRR